MLAKSPAPHRLTGWWCEQTLKIQDVKISGTLPSGWADELPHLQELSLGSLYLTGTLPPAWGTWPDLRRLSVFSTQVCARATHNYGCHMLTTLDLPGDTSGVHVPDSLYLHAAGGVGRLAHLRRLSVFSTQVCVRAMHTLGLSRL